MSSRKLARLGAVIALFSLFGCATNKEGLVEALYDYNEGIRWGRVGDVLAYLPLAKKDAYTSRMDAMRELRITNCRVGRVRFKGSGQALVTVTIDWYSLRQGRVNRTVMAQKWVRVGSRWMVRDNRWVRGPTLPIFAALARRRGAASKGAQFALP